MSIQSKFSISQTLQDSLQLDQKTLLICSKIMLGQNTNEKDEVSKDIEQYY
jgi:hypothetical protein